MKSLFSLEQYTKIFPRLKRKLSQLSQVGKRFVEWRKLRTFYGKPSQKYLQMLYKKSNCPSQKSLAFFRYLESRLDVVLYRAHFFETIATAKQEISVGRIEVNSKKVFSPNFNLIPGDIITVLPRCALAQKKGSLFEPLSKLSSLRFSAKDDSLLFNINNAPSENKVAQKNDFTIAKEVATFLKLKKYKKNCGSRFQSFSENGVISNKNTAFSFLLFNTFLKICQTSQQRVFDQIKTKAPLKDLQKAGDLFFKETALKNYLLNKISKISFNEFKVVENKKKWCFENRFKENRAVPFDTTYTTKGCAKGKALALPHVQIGDLQRHHQRFIVKPWLYDNKKLKSVLEESFFLLKDKQRFDIKNWLFLYFALLLRKRTISLKKKKSCFSEQRDKTFFKGQSFFRSKQVKPLHLEISYKSRSIVFLFPPQQVTFPTFIDLSQIYL